MVGPPSIADEKETKLPNILVGDTAFFLSSFLMKHYPRSYYKLPLRVTMQQKKKGVVHKNKTLLHEVNYYHVIRKQNIVEFMLHSG